MAERIRRDQSVRAMCVRCEDFVEPDNFAAVLGGGFDFVIDAIDSVRTEDRADRMVCRAQRQPLDHDWRRGRRSSIPRAFESTILQQTIQDPLLSKVRGQLRKLHGFPRGPKVEIQGERGVFRRAADLPRKRAACDIDDAKREHLATSPGHTGPVGLNCAGFGSSVCVTASFGFAAAAFVLRDLAKQARVTL